MFTHRHRGKAVRLERRTGVEAEPADPQQAGTDHGQRQRVRRHCFLQMADPGAGEEHSDQARDARVDVDHGPAGEVDRAEFEQQSVTRPDHVRERRVDDRQPKGGKEHHRGEADALDKSADHQRARDRREAHLEGGEDEFRNRLAACAHRPRRRLGQAGEARLRQAADQPVPVAEGEAVVPKHPGQDRDRGDAQHLAHHRQQILRSDEAAVEQRQSRQQHQHHQCSRNQHPCRIAAIELPHSHAPRLLQRTS